VGITHRSEFFQSEPPPLEEIVAEAEHASGLALTVPSVHSDTLFRYSADVAFEADPREQVTVYAYNPEALRRSIEQQAALFQGPGAKELAERDPRVARLIAHWSGVEKAPYDLGKSVHLRGFVGEEGTLNDVLALALESLGGSLTPPLRDKQRHDATGPITATTLRQRRSAHQRAFTKALLAAPMQLLRAWRRRK